MKIRLALLLGSWAFIAGTIAAQTPPPTSNWEYQYQFPELEDSKLQVESYSTNRSRPASEPQVIKKGPLAPAEEDRLKYAKFLSQPNTGLVRLLPQSSPTDPAGVKLRGGGAFYSFFYRSHEYGFGSDLSLTTPNSILYDDHADVLPGLKLPAGATLFGVGFAGLEYGMLTNVGITTLESITVDDARLAFLLRYKPPRAKPNAVCELRRSFAGMKIDGRLYQSRVPIQTGATYLLRSINYGTSDVLVAFQVLRKDGDGSVTIAWKLLKKFDRPLVENVKTLKGYPDKWPANGQGQPDRCTLPVLPKT